MKASWTLLKYQSVIQILKQDEFFPSPKKKVLLHQFQRTRQQILRSSSY